MVKYLKLSATSLYLRLCALAKLLSKNLRLIWKIIGPWRWAPGGCKVYGGRKSYRTTHPPEIFCTPRKERLVSLPRFNEEKEQRHPTGVENVPNEGGPKPAFGRAVIREVFLSPSFFHPSRPPTSLEGHRLNCRFRKFRTHWHENGIILWMLFVFPGLGNRKGGTKRIERFFWGKAYYREPPPNHLNLEATKGAGKRIIGGGVQNWFWGGVLWHVFPSPEFSTPPLFAREKAPNSEKYPILNVPQKGVGHFFLFRSLLVTILSLFLTFSVTFFPIPFCLPLLRQGDILANRLVNRPCFGLVCLGGFRYFTLPDWRGMSMSCKDIRDDNVRPTSYVLCKPLRIREMAAQQTNIRDIRAPRLTP